METQTEVVSLVNISTEKWPPRQRTYFGALDVRSPEPGEPYAVTMIRGCGGDPRRRSKTALRLHHRLQSLPGEANRRASRSHR